MTVDIERLERRIARLEGLLTRWLGMLGNEPPDSAGRDVYREIRAMIGEGDSHG